MAITMKHGTAILRSSQAIFFSPSAMNIPTTISAGAVAAAGTISAIGARNSETRNSTPVVKEARPVFAPCEIPAALST